MIAYITPVQVNQSITHLDRVYVVRVTAQCDITKLFDCILRATRLHFERSVICFLELFRSHVSILGTQAVYQLDVATDTDKGSLTSGVCECQVQRASNSRTQGFSGIQSTAVLEKDVIMQPHEQ